MISNIRKTRLLHPAEALWLVASPVIKVVLGFALLLAVCYALVGLNPGEVVLAFLVASVEDLAPVISRLVLLWLGYCLLYGLISGCLLDLWSMALCPGRLGVILERRRFFLTGFVSPRPGNLLRFLHLSVRQLLTRGHPVSLWVAGHSAQLE